jgi:uncharacterized membrane protein
MNSPHTKKIQIFLAPVLLVLLACIALIDARSYADSSLNVFDQSGIICMFLGGVSGLFIAAWNVFIDRSSNIGRRENLTISAGSYGVLLLVVYLAVVIVELIYSSERGSFLEPMFLEFSIAQVVITAGWAIPVSIRGLRIILARRQLQRMTRSTQQT